MTEDPATDAYRRTELTPQRTGELISPVARRGVPVAVYDTVTAGMIGWRFLRTWRWYGYMASAIIFAIACVLLSNWQFNRGQQTSVDNSIVATNFSGTPVPIEEALPSLGSFDASQNWQRVTLRGVYRTDDELIVRNRLNAGNNGFEVLTPLQLGDGSTFMIDRGWVPPSADDALAPDPIPQPPSGTVEIVAQLRPSEAPRGTLTPSGNQIGSITLPWVQQKIAGDLYTRAYGVLDSQSSTAQAGLTPIQTTMPIKDVSTHYSYALQWLLFALIGFIALGLGMRREYRRLNVDEPEEQVRASKRLRKRASKPFTDEELEDESLDGYIPLSRWGVSGGTASPPLSQPRTLSSGTNTTHAGDQTTGVDSSSSAPTVYSIHALQEPDHNEP